MIDLGNDVEGYLRASEIAADRVEDATTVLKEGQEVEAAVISLDRKNRSIQLSIKRRMPLRPATLSIASTPLTLVLPLARRTSAPCSRPSSNRSNSLQRRQPWVIHDQIRTAC